MAQALDGDLSRRALGYWIVPREASAKVRIVRGTLPADEMGGKDVGGNDYDLLPSQGLDPSQGMETGAELLAEGGNSGD